MDRDLSYICTGLDTLWIRIDCIVYENELIDEVLIAF